MFAFFITIHIIACISLILIVLVQQGRGGGLIESFSSAESIFGTKTNTFLVKATSILAVVFFVTCLAIAFLSIQKNKSLIETTYKPPVEQVKSEKDKTTAVKPDEKKSPEKTTSQIEKTTPEETGRKDTDEAVKETKKEENKATANIK